MSKVAYVVVNDYYGYESLTIESVWLNEELAKNEAARLNGPEHSGFGHDRGECTCPHKVYSYPVSDGGAL